MDAWRDVPAIVGLRRQVMRRNHEPFSSVLDAPMHALKLMCLGEGAFISVVEANGARRPPSSASASAARSTTWAAARRTGARGGSHLFLTLIERWFAEQPRGKLYLGITEPGYVLEAYERGNLLYRRKLRAISVPGTAFTLDPA